MKTLGEAYPEEQARLRELLIEYKKIPTGTFASLMIEALLRRADKAAIEQDLPEMIKIYQEMKGVE